MKRRHKRLKFDQIIIFSLYTNVYKHVYEDSIKDEKERSQYQDTICREAEEGYGTHLENVVRLRS